MTRINSMWTCWRFSLALLLCLVGSPVWAQSWTSPKTFVASDVLTASEMNTYVRDNTIVLRAGGIAMTSQSQGDLVCASSSTQLARCTAKAFINDTSNADLTIGLTINQGSSDDDIFNLKSSDVAHGMTSLAETDTFFSFEKEDGAAGGTRVISFSEATVAIRTIGRATTEDTSAPSGTSTAPVEFWAQLKSGTTVTNLSAGGINFAFRKGDGTTLQTLDTEGDLWLAGNLMLETGSSPQQTTPVSTGNVQWGIAGTTVWMGTPAVWFVVKNESGTAYRVPGYTP